jgi:hypothetical protein
METLSPITQYGPMTTSSSNCTFFPRIAVECTVAILSVPAPHKTDLHFAEANMWSFAEWKLGLLGEGKMRLFIFPSPTIAADGAWHISREATRDCLAARGKRHLRESCNTHEPLADSRKSQS